MIPATVTAMQTEAGKAAVELARMRRSVLRRMRRRRTAWASLPLGLALALIVYVAVTRMATAPSAPLPLQVEPVQVVLPHLPPPAAPVPQIAGWHLVWQSDFSQARSLGEWNVAQWANPYSHELQYYLPANVQRTGGVLAITARRQSYYGRAYTSGMVTTQGKVAVLYAKVLVRAKLVSGQGLWPAIWMLPEGGRVALPEIDIAEEQGAYPTTVWMSQHWQITKAFASDVHQLYTGPDFATAFHTFGITWTPFELVWTLDGVPHYIRKDHIPNVPLYLLVNLAVGGSYPGYPTVATHFPAALEVQWVRIYQVDPPRQPSLQPGQSGRV